MPPRKRLGQLLTELKVIDEHQLQSALGHQKQWGGKLGAILVQKGFCREDQMISALSQHLGMPAVRLSEVKIDPRAVKTVSKSVAERLHVFAYEVTGAGRSEVITIAMSDPTDLSAVDQLAFHTGKRIKPMLAGDSEVIAAIQQHYTSETPAQGAQPLAAGARPFVDGAQKGPGGTMRATPVSPLAAVPPAATPTPVYNKRVDPPRPPPAAMDPEIPASAAPDAAGPDAAPAIDSLGIEGDDLPADAPMEGLEPIAAHTQGAQSVEGGEEIAPQGGAADAEAPPLEDPAALPGWGEAQAEDVALATEDRAPPQAPGEGRWTVTAELPVDAIMGTADVLETPAENAPVASDAPDAWSDIADPLAAASPEASTGDSAWAAAAADVAAAAGEWTGTTEAEAPNAEPEAQAEAYAAEAGGDSLLAPPGDSPSEVEEVAIEAEGWSDESASAGAEAQVEASADQELATDAESQLPNAEASPPEGWLAPTVGDDQQIDVDLASGDPAAYADDSAAVASDAGPDPSYGEVASPGEAEGAYPDETQLGEQDGAAEPPPEGEGWIATAQDVGASGWFGDALSSTMPLSPADLGTLAAIGVDPSDGAAAQRVLACLVRVLNRRQAIDLDELAAEIRESQMAGEAAAQAEVDDQPAGESSAADVGAEDEGAQTSGTGQDPWSGSHGS